MDTISSRTVADPMKPKRHYKPRQPSDKPRKPRKDKGESRKTKVFTFKKESKKNKKFEKPIDKKSNEAEALFFQTIREKLSNPGQVVVIPENEESKLSLVQTRNNSTRNVDMTSYEFWNMVNEWNKKKEAEFYNPYTDGESLQRDKRSYETLQNYQGPIFFVGCLGGPCAQVYGPLAERIQEYLYHT